MAGTITRMSQLFLRTLRESPADADVPSHQLLVRAGYVRRAAPGIYTWLPLGMEVLRNVERVVREEMRAIGGQEVLFPALLPREPYQVTGRWEEYGDLLFRLKDRRGSEYLLGPTHEEMFTQLVQDQYSSYKDFPVILFQIQTKYRDEARPRGGILRGREFVMKDSYSFDLDDDGLVTSYLAHREAYQAIFRRLGLDFRIVSAMSGAMGGSASEEFLAPSPVGEDTFVSCGACGYAANVEAVTVAAPEPEDPAAHPPLEELPTPNTPTIETLADRLGVSPAQTLKSLVVKADGRAILVLVPGDREADMERLAGHLAPAKVELFTPEDFEDHPQLAKGYVGPQGAVNRGLTVYADRRVAVGSAWVTGANAVDTHARHVVNGRDFEVDQYVDVATIHPGDPCPRCGEPLALEQAIEIGHIFQLGRKYADAFALDAAGQDGRPIRITMGSYGIGVTRAVAAIAEQTHDASGLCWPREVAPADVHVVAVGKGDEVHRVAEQLSGRLEEAGWRVLLDDRRVAPGVAFADADLLGIGVHVVVGKALADGEVEVKRRKTGERYKVAVAGAVEAVSQELRAATPPSPPLG